MMMMVRDQEGSGGYFFFLRTLERDKQKVRGKAKVSFPFKGTSFVAR